MAVWLLSDVRVKLQTVTILGSSVRSGLSLVADYCNISAGYSKFENELNITKQEIEENLKDKIITGCFPWETSFLKPHDSPATAILKTFY